MEDRLLYSVHETAKILHSSPSYIYKLIAKGYLPAIKLGSYKIRKSTLEKFLQEYENKDLTDLSNIKPSMVKKSKVIDLNGRI